MKVLLDFLSELKENNNREWFQEHKTEYQNVLGHFQGLTEQLIRQLRLVDKDLPDMNPKDVIFRIYRDVRFSPDKSPYKTHFGAIIAEGGRKLQYGGYYLHIEPGASIAAGGVYRPPSDILKKIRRDIHENYEEFEEIINNKEFISTFGRLEGEKLVRPPKGFPADSPAMEWLKLKSYTVFHSLTDDEVCAPDFISRVVSVFSRMTPLIHFLNYAIKEG